jgi:glycosyltransferase involved in cell wall biosynthesis
MSARVPDATVTVSRSLNEHYRDRYKRQTRYIHNGVGIATSRPLGISPLAEKLSGQPYVLFVGRLVPEKSPDLLVRAFSALRGNARLVVVGGSSFTDAYAAQVHEIAAADRRVILPGYVYGEHLAALYSNAAAFVLPSRVEGLPLVLLEAASYGIPLIASDIPAHREIIGEDQVGRHLFRTGSHGELTDLMTNVLETQAQEKASAVAYSAHVLREYSWETAAAKLEDLYFWVIRKRQHGIDTQFHDDLGVR